MTLPDYEFELNTTADVLGDQLLPPKQRNLLRDGFAFTLGCGIAFLIGVAIGTKLGL